MSADHHRRLERTYLDARVTRPFEPRIRIGDGECEVEIDVRPDYFHAMDAVHGHVYFKLLDDAAFFAANSRVPDVFVLTSDFHVHFLAPVTGGVMRATGRVVHEGGRQILAEADVRDRDGRLVARGSGTFVKSRVPLTHAAAYRGD